MEALSIFSVRDRRVRKYHRRQGRQWSVTESTVMVAATHRCITCWALIFAALDEVRNARVPAGWPPSPVVHSYHTALRCIQQERIRGFNANIHWRRQLTLVKLRFTARVGRSRTLTSLDRSCSNLTAAVRSNADCHWTAKLQEASPTAEHPAPPSKPSARKETIPRGNHRGPARPLHLLSPSSTR